MPDTPVRVTYIEVCQCEIEQQKDVKMSLRFLIFFVLPDVALQSQMIQHRMRSTADQAARGGNGIGRGDRVSQHSESFRSPNIRHSNISSTGSSDHDSRKPL